MAFFQVEMTKQQVDAISILGLAHMGDGVFELLCRSYLCQKGGKKVQNLHRDTVNMVKAPAQAQFIEALLPHLTEEEMGYFRRGKNAHSHAAPKSATAQEYTLSTGLEALFGALYLLGRNDRLEELFALGLEARYGL